MTLDIRGSLKNTKLSKNTYVVIDELFSNAIDSFLIRKHNDINAPQFEATFDVVLLNPDLLGNYTDISIRCSDNGFGFNDEQTKAFVTKDTSYKDDLEITGIGQCKGSGRIQFLHHFNTLKVVSVFENQGLMKRELNVNTATKEIDEDSFKISQADGDEIGTTVTLLGLKSDILDSLFSSDGLAKTFDAQVLKTHLMVAFLQRLVGLKKLLGGFNVKIRSKIGDDEKEVTLTHSDLPKVTKIEEIKVFETDSSSGKKTESYEVFRVSHYKLDANHFQLPKNVISICAKSSAVLSVTNRYLRPTSVENNPVGANYHIVLIESDYLDRYVNEQRDGFDDIPEKHDDDLFQTGGVSFEEIFDSIDDIINDMIAPPDWKREEIVEKASEKFGISEAMITESETRVRYGDTAESVVSRVLNKYQKKAIKETSEIFNLKEEISSTDPEDDEFRKKVDKLAWLYTTSIRSIDMANLSQLVVRRAAIVEILGLAVKKLLKVQSENDGRRRDEEIIHNIFFPTKKDSKEVSDHDIWLLSEEYQYYDYIASEIALSKVRWDNDDLLFEEDIDEKFAELLDKNYKENRLKRPDIAIFNKEGSAIIIEFKAPGVSMDAHVGDLMEYAQLLAAKSKGRIKKFYGYLIGDTINHNRVFGYTKFPSNEGYFGTQDIIQTESRELLGELYSELLFYDDVVERAKKRISVYKERLNLQIN